MTERIYRHSAVTLSTNDDLKREIRLSPVPIFSVFSADEQTGGRGRAGRTFFSPPGGLYFSAALPLPENFGDPSFITLLAGLAVSECLDEAAGVKTEIKWPNDVYLNGKKAAGILSELVVTDFMTAVIGVGVNIGVPAGAIPEELRDKMTSLRIEKAVEPDPDALMRAITERIDAFAFGGERSVYFDQIRRRCFSVGKRVSFAGGEGVFLDILSDGSALIKTDHGEEKAVRSGEITHL